MMAHSAMNRGVMMSMIEHAIETGLPMPTDHEIAEHFGFDSVLLARTLLAELADKGLIHIIRENGERVGIGLGRAGPHAVVAEKPFRSVVRSVADEISAEASESASRRVAAGKISNRARYVQPTDAVVRAVTAPSAPPPNQRATSKQTGRIEVYLPLAEHGSIKARAEAEGIPFARYAAKMLSEALTALAAPPSDPPNLAHADVGQTVRSLVRRDRDVVEVLAQCHDALANWIAPKGKPLITGDVVRAAADAGIRLDEFVTTLIREALEARRCRVAEAAE